MQEMTVDTFVPNDTIIHSNGKFYFTFYTKRKGIGLKLLIINSRWLFQKELIS